MNFQNSQEFFSYGCLRNFNPFTTDFRRDAYKIKSPWEAWYIGGLKVEIKEFISKLALLR
ncbi:hypothetical protein [Aestuariivivens sediminis]|uniref:hypothetical protein n=1 Tax=Aestuariivivens sediminis TaxID=2913557 RepID=UPI001F59C449|nr:hypothetical protein [Aestuariivivens sediminis]